MLKLCRQRRLKEYVNIYVSHITEQFSSLYVIIVYLCALIFQQPQWRKVAAKL
jgi:hypothetical protein